MIIYSYQEVRSDLSLSTEILGKLTQVLVLLPGAHDKCQAFFLDSLYLEQFLGIMVKDMHQFFFTEHINQCFCHLWSKPLDHF